MTSGRRTLLLTGLLAALALSGCVDVGLLSEADEERVATAFEERFADLEGFTATVHTESTHSNASYETTAKVWYRPGTGEIRREFVAPQERAGDVWVTNQSATVHYDAGENMYERMNRSQVARTDDHLGRQLRDLLDRFEVHYNGTATVDGATTHKVTLLPENVTDIKANYRLTMWLDEETYFPVKQRVNSNDLDAPTVVRYENVTLDPGIDDATFEFDPPADATEAESETQVYQTREALVEAVNASVPDPNVPSGYDFQTGIVSTSWGTERITLQYRDGEQHVRIVQRDEAGHTHAGDETVDVGDATAQFSSDEDLTLLTWSCENRSYSAAGNAGTDEITTMAKSLGCPA